MPKNHRMTTRQPFAVDVPWLLGFSAESWIASQFSETSVPPYSCKTTVNNDLLTLISPLYSMKPSFLNLFMKKFTRERVVPIISARVSCETFGSAREAEACAPGAFHWS